MTSLRNITPRKASEVLSSLLIGGELESICAYSVQVQLKFLSDRLLLGALTSIELTALCQAEILSEVDIKGLSAPTSQAGRPEFLADIHPLIGSKVHSVEVDASGGLKVGLLQRTLVLRLDSDDMHSEDWVWYVSIEGSISPVSSDIHLGCSVCSGEVEFFGKMT